MEIVAENVIKLANKINVKYNTRYGTVNQAQLDVNLLSQA